MGSFDAILNSGVFRVLARDIGGPDPERMSPIKVEEAVKGAFPSSSGIKIEVISDEKTLLKEYPLYSAVNRAASGKMLLLVSLYHNYTLFTLKL